MTAVRSQRSAVSFERGIESVVREGGGRETLPAAEVGPAFFSRKPLLEQLYPLPNLDDYLREELAAQVNESALLLPYRFWQAVRKARARLRAAAAREPAHARLFSRAAAVLEDQDELFELLQEYRLALMQG